MTFFAVFWAVEPVGSITTTMVVMCIEAAIIWGTFLILFSEKLFLQIKKRWKSKVLPHVFTKPQIVSISKSSNSKFEIDTSAFRISSFFFLTKFKMLQDRVIMISSEEIDPPSSTNSGTPTGSTISGM